MGKVKFKRNTQSSRELRRIGEREQKREERRKQMDAFWALTPEERAARIKDVEAFQRIQKNGITLEDLRNCEQQGQQDGYLAGKIETLQLCYAAICLALKELHGYGQQECKEVLNAVDEKVTYALNSAELIQEVFDEMELEISFKDTFPGDRVTEKGAQA